MAQSESPRGTGVKLVLRYSPLSPFARKVRIGAAALGLGDRIEVAPADLANPADSLRSQNPLGKIPCLVLPDGTAVYDSRVILEYLESLAAGPRLAPEPAGPERLRVLTQAALADGIMDAAVLVVYEERYRPAEHVSAAWLDLQRGKIERGLAALAAAPPDPQRTDLASIGLACALGYLDVRKQVDWRPRLPALVAWLERFAAHQPAFEQTRPA
jgi:glutathione S-transferase